MSRRNDFFGGQFRGPPGRKQTDGVYNYVQDRVHDVVRANDRRNTRYDMPHVRERPDEYERQFSRDSPMLYRDEGILNYRDRPPVERDRQFPRDRGFSDQPYSSMGPPMRRFNTNTEPRRPAGGPPRFPGAPHGQRKKFPGNAESQKKPINNAGNHPKVSTLEQFKHDLQQKRKIEDRQDSKEKRQRTQSAEVTSTCDDVVIEKLHNQKFQDGSWLDNIKISDMDIKTFLLRALEKRMEDVWPQPKSLYFCRVCNYGEYVSQELLDRHLKSARHLEFQRHYSEAFCIDCQYHTGDLAGMEKHLQSQQHKEIATVVDITKSRAALYYKRKQGNISSDQSGPLSPKLPIESVKFHERLIEPKPIVTGIKVNKGESKTSKNENNILQHEDTVASVLPSTIEKVSEKPAKVENENNEIKVAEFTKLVEAKEQKSNKLFSNLRVNKSLIEQNKALLKKVESISESISNYCSKPSPIESILQKHDAHSGKTKTDNKKDENTNNKQSATEKNSENGTIKEQTENDSTNNRPIKSKITELIEKRRAEELEKEEKQKEKETEKQKSKVKTMKSKFDDFIIPLTGYMCTVCHQTLDDDDEALKHMNGYQHMKNTEYHRSKFGEF